jgi:FMN phosphatase YigB (HAD superfamily)
MSKCIVFDVFGTLYHYDRNIFAREYRKTFEVAKAHLPTLSMQQFSCGWRNSYLSLLQQAKSTQREFSLLAHSLDFVNSVNPTTKEKAIVARDLAHEFISEWLEGVTINREAAGMLARVYRKNILVAMSNVNDTGALYELFARDGIHRFFTLILTSAASGIRKPSTSMIQHTLDFLRVEEASLVIVGDDSVDKELADSLKATFVECRLPTRPEDAQGGVYELLFNLTREDVTT